jgi:hypothetical protein
MMTTKESTYPIRFIKKQKPIKDVDIEVDIIKTDEGLKVVRSGTDRELDWKVGGFDTEELALKMRDELEMGADVYVIPVRRTRGGRDKEYNLHIMNHPFEESAIPMMTEDEDPYMGVSPKLAYKTGYEEHPEIQHTSDINTGPRMWNDIGRGKTAQDQFGALWNLVWDNLKSQYEVRLLTPKQMPETWNVKSGQQLPNEQVFQVELRDGSRLNVTAKYYTLSKNRGEWKIIHAPLDRSQIESTFPTFKEFLKG